MSTRPPTKASPTLGTLVMYALPVAGTTMLATPAMSLLPGIYATRYGISMAAIGAVLMFVRLFDAAIDPWLGMMADRTKASRGTRKPWVAAGATASVLGALVLYSPPEPVTATTLFFGFLVLYIGWSAFEIPHSAWAATLAPAYADRTRAFAARALAYYIGGTVAFAIPLVAPGAAGQYSPSVLMATWAVSAAVVAVATLVALTRVPDPPMQTTQKVPDLREGWLAVIRNGPLKLFIVTYGVSAFGFGMAMTLSFVYMQSIVSLGGRIPLVYVLSTPAAIAGIAVWTWFAGRYGKRAVWLCVTAAAALIFLAFFWVPRTPASFPLVLALNLMIFFFFAGLGVASPAALADIVDFGRLKFGDDMGATYYAFFAMIVKASVGIAAGLGFALAGALGFDAQATSHSPDSLFGFMLAFSIIPAALSLLSLPLILAQPIDGERHAVIVRALDRRARRDAMQANSNSRASGESPA